MVTSRFKVEAREWDHHSICDIFESQDVEVILHIRVVKTKTTDTWFWKLDRKVCYTVKGAKRLLQFEVLPHVEDAQVSFWKNL